MEEGLMPQGAEPQNLVEARRLRNNFILMSMCFSLNHGSVTSVIALATSFSESLGTYSLAALYACYVVTAMLFSQLFIHFAGQKGTLIFSLGVYTIYIASYLVAALVPGTAWGAVMFGACIGGIGAGLLWTAQGAYYTANARLYATAVGISPDEASSLFSSIFAFFYLGCEVSLKVIGSLTAQYSSGESGKYAIYVLYTAIAVGSTLGISLVRPMHDLASSQEESKTTAAPLNVTEKVSAALTLLFTNAKCALMVPTNFAFGFAASFITAYVQGSVVSPVHTDDGSDDDEQQSRHDSRVLLYSSIAVAVATLCSLPFHYLRERFSTQLVMLWGASCFSFVAISTWALAPGDLRQILVLVYVVYGMGRSVWESTLKAVFAEFFPTQPQAAFANIVLQSGVASTIGFAAFGSMTAQEKEFLLLFTSVLGAIGYLMANQMHKRQMAATADSSAYYSLNTGA